MTDHLRDRVSVVLTGGIVLCPVKSAQTVTPWVLVTGLKHFRCLAVGLSIGCFRRGSSEVIANPDHNPTASRVTGLDRIDSGSADA